MKYSLSFTLVLVLILPFASVFPSSPKVDGAAPEFTLSDVNGKKVSLTDYRGKFIVLEWVNFDCPFVRKHYGSGNMQELQRRYIAEGVAWLSICSSAEGKQGHFKTADLKKRISEEKASPTAYLIDEDGTVGKLYDAKTTPHMFIINPEGVLTYAGGIDDIRSTDQDDIATATNYVSSNLDALLAGKEALVKGSQPYGCSVKYK